VWGAGATLGEIVGGLLVTRYITLESELQAARERLLSSEALLAEANTGLAEVEDELRTYQIADALEHDDVIRTLLGTAVIDCSIDALFASQYCNYCITGPMLSL